MSSTPDGLERARQELAAAALLAQNGFNAQAVSRSYYAAFYASEAALQPAGVTRSKHSGVVAAVATVLVRDHGLNPDAGRQLRSLFERRSRADYGLGDTPAAEAHQAVADAAHVVNAVADWLGMADPSKE
jgi:uncharacterized protein (UPF0332 family)